MRRIKLDLSGQSSAWEAAVRLTETYLSGNAKADGLLSYLPESFDTARRARCQHLFLGALRHGHRVRYACAGLMRHRPAAPVEARLLVTGFELLADAESEPAQIVHHAVERSKQPLPRKQTGFLNAVLRKLPEALDAMDPVTAPAAFHSHPEWLYHRWKTAFGREDAMRLMAWNQRVPDTYLRFYGPGPAPDCLTPTEWPGYYRVPRGGAGKEAVREILASGSAYIKDPATRLAAEHVMPAPGETLLDLCAAPGGKARDLAHLCGAQGHIVAVDLPGERQARLEENVASLFGRGLRIDRLEADVLALDTARFARANLPAHYDAVLLDAPCSNTGVIRRRPDVKWRLEARDIDRCAEQQLRMLRAAAPRVRPGGRLVYSTCSIETAENRDVAERFLGSPEGSGFRLDRHTLSLPWETGHDGAGVFRLLRTD